MPLFKIPRKELELRARHMRTAIDQIESALMGFDELQNQLTKWEGASGDVRVKLNISVRQLNRIHSALSTCNAIVNSEAYSPRVFGWRPPKLTKLLKRAAAQVDAMTPEQKEAMLRKQAEGVARSEVEWARDYREGKTERD